MPESPIRVIERAVTILDCIVAAREPLGITELSRRTGLSKSTVHHFVTTLCDTALLATDPVTRRYRLGPKLAQLGNAFMESTDLRDLAQPALAELRDLTGETATLHVRMGDDRITMAQATSTQSIRRVLDLGVARPLHLGAVGIVLMGGLTDEEIGRLLSRSRPRRLTSKTVIERDAILDLVRQARADGYSLLSEQTEEGIGVIALPVHDHRGGVPAAIVVSGPIQRWHPETIAPLIGRIRAIVDGVSRQIGRPSDAPVTIGPDGRRREPATALD